MIGEIYIITNDINSKVYIGQTVQGIDTRFYQHKLLARRGGQSKLAKAIRELGEEHFRIKLIESVDKEQLTEMEAYYINKYNSISCGYNSVLPIGDTIISKYDIIAEHLEELLSDYLSGITYNVICEKYSISRNYLAKVCSGLSELRADTSYINGNNEPKRIIAYNIDFEPVGNFRSISKILGYIKNLGYSSDEKNLYNYINAACKKGNIAYGHRWQLAEDLVYEDKIFRTKFDKEAYINGGTAYQPDGKQYWIVDGSLTSVKGYRDKNVSVAQNYVIPHFIKNCEICGKPIDRKAKLCGECYNKKKSAHIPDKDTLVDLIGKYSYEAIGRQYGVSGKAVRKWCDKYDVYKYRMERDNSGVTCVEFNITFKTFRDAAQYLLDNGFSTASDIRDIAYNISLAKRENRIAYGFY